MASRRMGKQGLTRGFNAWLELWSELKRQRQMLQRAVARVAKPMLASAFIEWAMGTEETRQKAALSSAGRDVRNAAKR